MNEEPATPIVLTRLTQWRAELIDQTCRRIELALAHEDIGRAHRVLADYERVQAESPPVESLGLDSASCERLRRRGVVNLSDLQAAAGMLDQWPEISERLRARVRAVLERLG